AVPAQALAGRVGIAAFVFTRCPDMCPALSTHMAALQDPLASGDDPVRLVSISVDPAHDDPGVLTTYAGHYRAGPNWLFLTGARDAVATLLRNGFRVAYADDGPPTAPITHSDRFVLVDRTLRIRGYYHGSDQEVLRRLTADARALRPDPRPGGSAAREPAPAPGRACRPLVDRSSEVADRQPEAPRMAVHEEREQQGERDGDRELCGEGQAEELVERQHPAQHGDRRDG